MTIRHLTGAALAIIAAISFGCDRGGGTAKNGHGHDHGERHELGTKSIGAFDVTVVQLGEVHEGHGVLEIKVGGLEGGKGTVRAWIGAEGAPDADKTKATYAPDHDDFDVEAKAPATLGAGAKAWVEVTPTGGEPVVGSFDLHMDGDAHGHADEHVLPAGDIGGYAVKPTLFGHVEAGGEGHVTLDISGGDAAPTAVRVWIGDEAGTGAVKKKFDVEKTDAGWSRHDHIEVPATLAEGSKLWVEIESADGTQAGSFDLPKE